MATNKQGTVKTRVVKGSRDDITVQETHTIKPSTRLTEKEVKARQLKKYATTTFGFGARNAFSGGDVSMSSQGNFYSPQLSTDFLEKPQNLRERRAWYRQFYNGNEFVGAAIDLHSSLPLSKIRLEKPKCENEKMGEYIYTFFEDMCNDINLFKVLREMSHEYWLMGNCSSRYSLILNDLQGFVKAEDVSVGDKILTHNNRFRKVTKKCSRISEKITEISLYRTFDKLELTDEHPVEVYRNGKFEFIQVKNLTTEDYVRVTWPDETFDISTINYLEGFDNIKVTETGYDKEVTINRERQEQAQDCREKFLLWLASLKEPTIKTRDEIAQDLGTTRCTLDNVLLQIKKEIGKIFSKRIGAKGYQKGSQVEWQPISYDDYQEIYTIKRTEKFIAPHTIDIDEDFCYLLGYWLGDGTLARDNARPDKWGRGIWNIVFGEKSIQQADKIRAIIVKKFGESAIKEWNTEIEYYEGKFSRMKTIKVGSNPAFVEWWASQFGETSHGKNKKRIPLWVNKLPNNKLHSLLAGLIDSDGSVSGKYYVLGLTSDTIIRSVRDIALKCNIICSTFKRKCNYDNKLVRNKTNNCRDFYTILLRGEDCINTIGNIAIKKIIADPTMTFKSSKYIKTSNGDIAFRIKSIVEKNYNDLVYNFEVEEDHTYQVNGFSTHNCFIFAEDHDPYNVDDDEKEKVKEEGKGRALMLYDKFKIRDKDPNYKGWRKLIVLPPDQVRIKKMPLTDDSLVEFMPDPDTKKMITGQPDRIYGQPNGINEQLERLRSKLPESLMGKLEEGGSIPMDTDPFTGSFVFHLARKKSQYETLGVSILERCINTLLLQDKLRQAQTSIASRHMTPIRIVWGEELSEDQTNELREQVDMALVDPDFSIIANYQVNWEEMGSGGRLLELSSEYDHIENSLFAGLNVTREMLTGEGTYSGNKITLHIMNNIYLNFRDDLQEYVENYLFKPIAYRKGFIEKDEFGREKLIYPRLTFTRLAIKDNDAYFDQLFQLYQKGSVSIDVILDIFNIDPVATRKKLESDLFTVNDPTFNTFLQALYNAAGSDFAAKYDVNGAIAKYLNVPELPPGAQGEGGLGGLGGLGGGSEAGASRFASTLNKNQKNAMANLMKLALQNPDKLDKLSQIFKKKQQ